MNTQNTMEKNKEILKALIEKAKIDDAYDVYMANEKILFDVYKNYKTNKIAETIYAPYFNELQDSSFTGKMIIFNFQSKYEKESAENRATTAEAKAEENYKELQKLLDKIGNRSHASKPEMFIASAFSKFISVCGLQLKYGILTHQKFRSEESIRKTLYREIPAKGTPMNRETDFQIIFKETGEKLLFMVDGKTNHNKKRDDASSNLLRNYGTVIRLREKGSGGINSNLCTAFNIGSLKYQTESEYKQLKRNIKKAFKNVSSFIPEMKDFDVSDDFLNDVFFKLAEEYRDIQLNDPIEELSKEEAAKIISVRDKLNNKDYTDKKEMLEEFLRLNLSSDIKKNLMLDPEWVTAFKKAASLTTAINIENKKNK